MASKLIPVQARPAAASRIELVGAHLIRVVSLRLLKSSLQPIEFCSLDIVHVSPFWIVLFEDLCLRHALAAALGWVEGLAIRTANKAIDSA